MVMIVRNPEKNASGFISVTQVTTGAESLQLTCFFSGNPLVMKPRLRGIFGQSHRRPGQPGFLAGSASNGIKRTSGRAAMARASR